MIKHWSPLPEITNYVSSLIKKEDDVLELGPGAVPFSRTTHSCGWDKGPGGINFKDKVDFNTDQLPYEDKEFDFVYCRHVLEDLYNPFNAVKEMARVAQRGYIEIPSPIAEIAKGVDGGSPKWRGYHHHRYFVWSHAGVLHFMPKFPMVEHLTFNESKLNELLENKYYWNSYHQFEGEIKIKHHQHMIDFTVSGNYKDEIADAVMQSVYAVDEFIKERNIK